MTSVLFRNGALLDPLQPELIPGHEVLVEEGRIKEVSDRPIKTTGARVIDLKGKTLMPGLIDLHVLRRASAQAHPDTILGHFKAGR